MTHSLCCIHGNFGSPNDWKPLLRALEEQEAGIEKVFTPCLWDYVTGGDNLSFETSLAAIAADIHAALPDPAVVVGYSLGARLALGLVLAHPQLFSEAVLISAHPGLTTEAEKADRRRSDEEWARRCEDSSITSVSLVRAWREQSVFVGSRAADELSVDMNLRGRLAKGFRAWSLGAMPYDITALEQSSIPVRWVVGAADGKFRKLAEERVHGRYHRVSVAVIAGAGHRVHLDRPEILAKMLNLPAHQTRE